MSIKDTNKYFNKKPFQKFNLLLLYALYSLHKYIDKPYTKNQTPNTNTFTNLTPRQETMSPAIAGAKKFLFNSSDPNLQKKMYQFHSGEIIRKKNSFNLPPPSSCKSFSFFQSIVRRRWDLYLRLFVLLFAIDVLIFGQVKTIIQPGSDKKFTFMVKSLLSLRR